MTEISHGRSLLMAQKGLREDLRALFTRAAHNASGALARYASGPEGVIPPSSASLAARDAGDAIQRVFVIGDGRTSLDEATGRPLSAYARVLVWWMGWGVREVVRGHERSMARYLPDDVAAWLRGGRINVAEQDEPRLPVRVQQEAEWEALRARYADLRLFHPHPLAEGAFDPNRQWVRPDRWADARGYRLSDRIWEASVRTRMKIDAFTLDAIRGGMGALDLARRLEQFVVPGRAAIRTQKPYGVDASFDAMRLARSEIGRVQAQAAWVSAYLNPYVSQLIWRLSPSHPRIDICDDLAAGSPYALTAAPLPIISSHPQCLCYVVAQVADTPSTVTARLRAAMEESREVNLLPHMTPLEADTFTSMLLGPAITQLLRQLNPMQLGLGI